ncbi:MAG: N-6 DNA methylase [Candidatus Cloacimonadota bacterium]|nr:MAG: N-6 DNA methylase [Candidatus Cloacimonadota bacterium]
MITGELKNRVDLIWETIWSGGISNPLTAIEQISYLLFIKRLDDLHTAREKKANLLEQEIENPIFNSSQNKLRWSRFKDFSGSEMFDVVSREVFPFIKEMSADTSSFSRYMKDAVFNIPSAALLEKLVDQLQDLPMEDRDTKGDLYEYLLSQLSAAGKNGQFRTPRHIIKMMVELMKPRPDDLICDPACGTAGFLVAAGEYLRKNHKEIFYDEAQTKHFNEKLFSGFDFDPSMLRISSMNMMLHGVENPNIAAHDSLADLNSDVENHFSLILANPPFKGSLDESGVAKNLISMVKTKKTELLFLALMLRTLKLGGRCAVIIPDGVLFGSSKAHKTIRKELIENHKLEAVISLPSGVFKPYAGVSTGILIFTKTDSGGTSDVWFYDMQADGFSLDDKRNSLDLSKHSENNLPDVIKRFENLSAEKGRKRTDQSFMVPLSEIQENDYDLSINRYKEIVYEEVKYDAPKVILKELMQMEKEIQQELLELDGMLG